MTSIEVPLPKSLRQFVDSQERSGRYRTPAEYLAELIRADEKRHAKEQLEALLLAGVRSKSREMTAEEWEDIRVQGMRRVAALQSSS